MERMLALAEEQGIIVKYHDFADPIKGIYWAESDMPPVIGLNKGLRSNTPLLRCVMAEELGHHFTTVGHCVPREFYHHSMRTRIHKAEYKALRWAAKYLIPLDKLEGAWIDGLANVGELAEHFNVIEHMMLFRIRLFHLQHGCTSNISRSMA